MSNRIVVLSEEQTQRAEDLTHIVCKRCWNSKEKGEYHFLNMLFKFENKDIQELKKYINKLYAANKKIDKANRERQSLSNYLIDILALNDILQADNKVQYTFFRLAYDYIK